MAFTRKLGYFFMAYVSVHQLLCTLCIGTRKSGFIAWLQQMRRPEHRRSLISALLCVEYIKSGNVVILWYAEHPI